MKTIWNRKDLLDALAETGDNGNDIIVIEVHDTTLNEDLYRFTVDVIEGIDLYDDKGKIVERVKEIRLCPIQNQVLLANPENDEFKCEDCGGIFDNDDSVKLHKSLFCIECGKKQ